MSTNTATPKINSGISGNKGVKNLPPKPKKRFLLYLGIFIFVLVLIGVGVFLYMQRNKVAKNVVEIAEETTEQAQLGQAKISNIKISGSTEEIEEAVSGYRIKEYYEPSEINKLIELSFDLTTPNPANRELYNSIVGDWKILVEYGDDVSKLKQTEILLGESYGPGDTKTITINPFETYSDELNTDTIIHLTVFYLNKIDGDFYNSKNNKQQSDTDTHDIEAVVTEEIVKNLNSLSDGDIVDFKSTIPFVLNADDTSTVSTGQISFGPQAEYRLQFYNEDMFLSKYIFEDKGDNKFFIYNKSLKRYLPDNIKTPFSYQQHPIQPDYIVFITITDSDPVTYKYLGRNDERDQTVLLTTITSNSAVKVFNSAGSEQILPAPVLRENENTINDTESALVSADTDTNADTDADADAPPPAPATPTVNRFTPASTVTKNFSISVFGATREIQYNINKYKLKYIGSSTQDNPASTIPYSSAMSSSMNDTWIYEIFGTSAGDARNFYILTNAQTQNKNFTTSDNPISSGSSGNYQRVLLIKRVAPGQNSPPLKGQINGINEANGQDNSGKAVILKKLEGEETTLVYIKSVTNTPNTNKPILAGKLTNAYNYIANPTNQLWQIYSVST